MAVVQHPVPAPMFFTALAADTKPTLTAGPVGQAIPNGAVLYTTDTPNWYIYSSTNGWSLSTQSEV